MRTWLQRYRRLLQAEPDGACAPVVEATGGEGIEFLVKRDLHMGKRFHAQEAGVTELPATKGEGTAGDTISFEMVAGTVGHKTSKGAKRPLTCRG